MLMCSADPAPLFFCGRDLKVEVGTHNWKVVSSSLGPAGRSVGGVKCTGSLHPQYYDEVPQLLPGAAA